MTEKDMERRVRGVIARAFGVSADEPNLQMGVLPQWDSMGHMQLVAEIESEFQVSFPSYELAGLVSVEAIALAITKLEAR